MSAWDINNIRRIAGLPPVAPAQLNESAWSEDSDSDTDYGDDDPDARIADEDKSQKKFEKKNKKELKSADSESKELSKKKPAEAKKAEPKKEEPKKAAAKPVEKKEEPKKAEAKPAEKKEEPKKDPVVKADSGKEKSDEEIEKEHQESSKKAGAMWDALKKGEKHAPAKAEKTKPEGETSAEAKKRGRAHNPDSKQGKAREWLASNANHTRGAFIAHMTAKHGMSSHHANTMYYAEKKRNASKATDVKEVYFIQHPFVSTYLLGENRELNKFDWVDHDGKVDPMVFETAQEAEKMMKYMSEWKGQPTKLVTYTFEDEEDAE